ncbi:FixH family protein [Olivibacter sp. SDN3]|uniref:FixH family protein n=1 Tax=Olivibacter sp. SDN3 TaxID=2764720 RepID=UPI0016511FBA|nr:FixH family protein [Olivibacter sp. SDN3]QNL48698.1 FixH family protein [Olivibacter sp. SDN3]
MAGKRKNETNIIQRYKHSKEMNWGLKIVIGMAMAMTSIVATGIYMVSKDTDTLEEGDYYEKGLSYDDEYAKKENVLVHHARPAIKLLNDSLIINFQHEKNRGMISFRRPSDRAMDRNVVFTTTAPLYKIPINELRKGVWHLRLEWESAGITYLENEELYIP